MKLITLLVATMPAFMQASPTLACAGHDAIYRSSVGAPADGAPYEREVLIGPATKHVSVTSGQVVRFVLASDPSLSFTWNFDTWGGRFADLRRLAPRGMLAQPVQAYIAEGPHYGGG
jgi:hypothetical protein